jgi:DNA-binding NarL/FixJ family response regulator
MVKNIQPEVLAALSQNLSPEDTRIFRWLREGFSPAWIAETTLQREREVTKRAKEVFRSLEVRNQKELIRYYGALERGKEQNYFELEGEPA